MVLTEKQREEARAEGWKVQGNYVARAYDYNGGCPFDNTFAVVEHICHRGKESEWHRELFMSLPWTSADSDLLFVHGFTFRVTSGIASVHGLMTPVEAGQRLAALAAAGEEPIFAKALANATKQKLLQGTGVSW